MGFANYQNVCVFVISGRVCVLRSVAGGPCRQCCCRVARISFECRLYALDAVLGRLLVKIKSSCSFSTMQGLSCARYNGTGVSVHWTPHHYGVWGSGSLISLRLNLRHSRKSLVDFTPRSFDSRRKSPHPPCGPRAGCAPRSVWHAAKKTKIRAPAGNRIPVPRLPTRNAVDIRTELS
jgi:hypothetical protein